MPNKYYELCSCGLSHPACNAHAPFILPSVARLTVPNSSRYLIKGTILGKHFWRIKRVLILSTIFVRNIFRFKKT